MTRKKAKKRAVREDLDPNLPIFQLKITLDDIEPAIWRRIQTHDCTLADLHEIIQSCMGWDDDHMHVFEVGNDQYMDFSRGARSPYGPAIPAVVLEIPGRARA